MHIAVRFMQGKIFDSRAATFLLQNGVCALSPALITHKDANRVPFDRLTAFCSRCSRCTNHHNVILQSNHGGLVAVRWGTLDVLEIGLSLKPPIKCDHSDFFQL